MGLKPDAGAGDARRSGTRMLLAFLFAFCALALAWLAGATWFPLGPAIAYSSAAGLVALMRGRAGSAAAGLGWLAMAACVAAGWTDLPVNDAPWIAALLAPPVAGSMLSVVRYVRGTPELLAVERRSRRWRRAGIAASVVVTIAIVVWTSVVLGLRADRMDRADETIDRLNASLSALAKELEPDALPAKGLPDERWRDTLIHGALTTGRSLIVVGPAVDGSRSLIAGAIWSRSPRIHVRFADRKEDVSPEMLAAAMEFAARPDEVQRIDVAWRYGAGNLPAGRPLLQPTESDDGRSGAGELNVYGTWTDADPYILISLPATGDEWWNEQGRRDYLRSATVFFLWIDVVLVTVCLVLMTALDSRWALLASLHAERQRAALRRDAHDRVYNRLAAIAHSLETQEGDRAMGRNASFEILSAVGYLQRILGSQEVDAPSPLVAEEKLRRQLMDVCESSERLWGMSVVLSVSLYEAIDAKSSWDIQCVVDEALSNAGEHGGANEALVSVEVAEGRVYIMVRDNGTWVGKESSSSSGLAGMRERLLERGGFIRLEHDETGTIARAEFGTRPRNDIDETRNT